MTLQAGVRYVARLEDFLGTHNPNSPPTPIYVADCCPKGPFAGWPGTSSGTVRSVMVQLDSTGGVPVFGYVCTADQQFPCFSGLVIGKRYICRKEDYRVHPGSGTVPVFAVGGCRCCPCCSSLAGKSLHGNVQWTCIGTATASGTSTAGGAPNPFYPHGYIIDEDGIAKQPPQGWTGPIYGLPKQPLGASSHPHSASFTLTYAGCGVWRGSVTIPCCSTHNSTINICFICQRTCEREGCYGVLLVTCNTLGTSSICCPSHAAPCAISIGTPGAGDCNCNNFVMVFNCNPHVQISPGHFTCPNCNVLLTFTISG